MTKPPVAVASVGSSAPRCRLDSQPRAAAVAPLHRQHDQVERVHRLDLDPARHRAGPRRTARRRTSRRRPRGRGPARPRRTPPPPRRAPGHAGSATASRGPRTSAGSAARAPRGGREPARRAGRGRRGAGRRRRTAVSGTLARGGAPGRCGWPVREPVCWNGRGRPSSSSAITSPSRTTDAAPARGHRLDDLRQPVGDVVQ